jgi:hypothetical protein
MDRATVSSILPLMYEDYGSNVMTPHCTDKIYFSVVSVSTSTVLYSPSIVGRSAESTLLWCRQDLQGVGMS